MSDNPDRRNWLQLSMRGALAFTSFGAVSYALLRKRLDAARQQEYAIHELESMGAVFAYAHEREYFAGRSSKLPTIGPKLIRLFTGDHFYLVPDMVMFDEFDGTALDLRRLTELETITSISFTHAPNVDDKLVNILLQLPDLEYINLYGTSLTLRGLSQLTMVPKLRMLHVSHTIRDAEQADVLSTLFADGVVRWSDEPYSKTSDMLFEMFQNGT